MTISCSTAGVRISRCIRVDSSYRVVQRPGEDVRTISVDTLSGSCVIYSQSESKGRGALGIPSGSDCTVRSRHATAGWYCLVGEICSRHVTHLVVCGRPRGGDF